MYKIDFNEHRSLILADSKAYSFEVTGRDSGNTQAAANNDKSFQQFSSWQENKVIIGNWLVFPYGKNNRLPNEIQEAIFPNNIAPRTLTKKAFLLYGQGPVLYTEKRKKNSVKRTFVEDKEIQEFLDSCSIEDSIMSSIIDYYYTEGVFHKIRRAIGQRIGSNEVPIIEYEDLSKCRLAKKKTDKGVKPTHVLVGDWSNPNNKDFEVYPLFDANNPLKYKVAIAYNKMKAFAFDNYSMPDLYGSLPWIKRASSIPYIIEAYTNNSLNLKFHIQSPKAYWDDLEVKLKENATKTGRTYKSQELEDAKQRILQGLTEVLSGVNNVGKFWHSTQVIELLGGRQVEHKWEIKPIDQKIKDYITAQLDIAKFAGFATTAGLGLHNALANVGADGKSDSGSEQLYALKNHQMTEMAVPEMIVCKIFNNIIKWRWPDKNIKLGFYSHTPEKEQNINPKDRFKNQ